LDPEKVKRARAYTGRVDDRYCIQLIQFPACCGAGIAYNFDIFTPEATQAQFIMDLASCGWGVVCATTTASQRTGNKILKYVGFRPVSVTKNPNSGNNVTFWVLDLKESKKKVPDGTNASNSSRL